VKAFGRASPAAEEGSSTAELVLVLPVLMLLVAFAMQLALWALASHAVQASAATAGDVARGLGATPAEASAAARAELAAVAGGLVGAPEVQVTTAASGVSVVVVSGSVPSLIPGLHLEVSATSVGPLGEFRGSG
jgi:Flp pilus assembly protein TadG